MMANPTIDFTDVCTIYYLNNRDYYYYASTKVTLTCFALNLL